MKNSLGDLADSKKYQKNINISKFSPEDLEEFLVLMKKIRFTEQKLAKEREAGLIGGPVHLCAGQEAIAVGISKHLRKTDCVYGGHRSHSHLMALNPDSYKLFAETLGKDTGFSKGMGGSMHLIDKSNGFHGATPIVAGTISLAVGAGLAEKLKKTRNIAVCYLGDGAAEEGVFQEALNFSKIMDIPILFVIENNLFSSHLHISSRQPSNMVSRMATNNHIKSLVLDGNDVCEVSTKAKEIISQIRVNAHPFVLELITFRHYGHVDWREDIDVGVERGEKDIQNWKLRDPILRLKESMISKKIWSDDLDLELDEKITISINDAWNRAIKDQYPDDSSLLNRVYF